MNSNKIEQGDLIRIKREWLDKGESPNALYVVLSAYDDQDGVEVAPLKYNTFIRPIYFWSKETMHLYKKREEWESLC